VIVSVPVALVAIWEPRLRYALLGTAALTFSYGNVGFFGLSLRWMSPGISKRIGLVFGVGYKFAGGALGVVVPMWLLVLLNVSLATAPWIPCPIAFPSAHC
jgi:hypothetical protein